MDSNQLVKGKDVQATNRQIHNNFETLRGKYHECGEIHLIST